MRIELIILDGDFAPIADMSTEEDMIKEPYLFYLFNHECQRGFGGLGFWGFGVMV